MTTRRYDIFAGLMSPPHWDSILADPLASSPSSIRKSWLWESKRDNRSLQSPITEDFLDFKGRGRELQNN